jgi:zincin-like metallopeptidase toxin 3 of polymorphic toxin system
MKLTAGTIGAYPKFAYYIRVNMPQVSTVQTIVSRIKKLAGKTSRKTILTALQYGTSPEIQIVPNLVCAGVKAYGCYTFGTDVIQIDKKLVEDFEKGKGVVKTSDGRKLYLVGVTLLHELTHWADSQDGVDDPVPGDPGNEEGNAYEIGVYGKVLD